MAYGNIIIASTHIDPLYNNKILISGFALCHSFIFLSYHKKDQEDIDI